MILPMFLILNNFREDLASVALISAEWGVAAGESKGSVVFKGGISGSWALSPDLEVLMPGECDVISGDQYGLIESSQ